VWVSLSLSNFFSFYVIIKYFYHCNIIVDLRLGLNKFSGPLTALTSLQNLETLHLNDNAFNGTIPNMFDQLFRLHELMMQRNQFVGSIPLTLTHLQSMSKYSYKNTKSSVPGSSDSGYTLCLYPADNDVISNPVLSILILIMFSSSSF
jgi:hypothetical protein